MDWTVHPERWIQHLHAHGWRLGVGDELIIHTLAQRLRARGEGVGTAEDAARWFGPLLCGSADDQRRLLPLLQAWQGLAAPPAAPSSRRSAAPPRQCCRPRRRPPAPGSSGWRS